MEKKAGFDYTGVSVVFMCHDGNGRFVMGKRGPNNRDEIGKWDIGGGRIEFGESPEAALRREIREEYGAIVEDFKFVGYRSVNRIVNSMPDHWIALDFIVKVDPLMVQNGEPNKQLEVRFFTLSNYPKDESHSQFPCFLENHKAEIESALLVTASHQ